MSRKSVIITLGQSRIPATYREIEQLTADGYTVELIVADLPEWDRAATIDGVKVHRVPRSGKIVGAARKVLHTILGGVSLLVLGDPPAILAAYWAAKRRPGLTVRFEPDPEPERLTRPADLAVVTPWYPSFNNPMAGAFVQATVECLDGKAGSVSILHTEDWSPTPRHRWPIMVPAADRLVPPRRRTVVADTPLGELTRVPVLVQRHNSYFAWASDHVAALRAALPTGRIEAPVIHAHTAIFAGVVAAKLARQDAKIVITEHSTFLQAIFAQPKARDLYDQALHRCDTLIAVSTSLRDEIAEQFPWHRDKLRVIANPLDFERFTPRTQPPDDLKRWIYIGRFNALKRVDLLLEAFGVAAAADPDLTLTMVGAGDLSDKLRQRTGELGLAERVEFRPQVLPDQVPALLREHDLLVHASSHETFGLTVVESVATETPVLATRTAGSSETLAGIEDQAGALFEVADGPAEIAARFAELRTRTLDLPAARESLKRRYDRHAVGAQLLELYQETPGEAPDGERILMLALSPASYHMARESIDLLHADNTPVDLVVTDPTPWRAVPGLRVFVLAHPRRFRKQVLPLLELDEVHTVVALDKPSAKIATQLAAEMPQLHVIHQR